MCGIIAFESPYPNYLSYLFFFQTFDSAEKLVDFADKNLFEGNPLTTHDLRYSIMTSLFDPFEES